MPLMLAVAVASFATLAASVAQSEPTPLVALDTGGHTDFVTRLIADRYQLISISHDKTVRIWDLASFKPVRVLRPPIGRGPLGELDAAALSPDGQTLAVSGNTAPEGTTDHYIWLIAISDGHMLGRLAGNTAPVRDLAFSPDGKWLASGGDDSLVRLWKTDDWRLARAYAGHTDAIRGLAWNPASDHFVTGSADHTCRLRSVANENSIVLSGHKDAVHTVAWSHDGRTIASGAGDSHVLLWDADGGLRTQLFTASEVLRYLNFSRNDETLLYGCGSDRSIHHSAGLINVADGRLLTTYERSQDTPLCGIFSTDGKWAIIGDADAEIRVHALATGEVRNRLRSQGQDVYANGWSPDGRLIAYGHTGNDLQRLQVTNKLEKSFSLEKLDFGPTPSDDFVRAQPHWGGLTVGRSWYAPSVVSIKRREHSTIRYQVPNAIVRSLTMLTDHRVAIGTDLETLVIDALTHRLIWTLPAHTGIVWSLSPSPDMRYLLSGSGDQTLQVWNLDRYEHILSLFFAGEEWIAWTPQGYYAASFAGESLMGWHVQRGFDQMADFYPASHFHARFYRPDVIRRIVDASGPWQALQQADFERQRESVPMIIGSSLPPQVNITTSTSQTEHTHVEVKAAAQAAQGDQIGSFQLLVDGRPHKAAPNETPCEEHAAATDQWSLDLTPGKHTLARHRRLDQ